MEQGSTGIADDVDLRDTSRVILKGYLAPGVLISDQPEEGFGVMSGMM